MTACESGAKPTLKQMPEFTPTPFSQNMNMITVVKQPQVTITQQLAAPNTECAIRARVLQNNTMAKLIEGNIFLSSLSFTK